MKFIKLLQTTSPKGEAIRDIRLSLNVSQADAAKMSGMSCRAWQNYEAGKRQMPHLNFMAFLEQNELCTDVDDYLSLLNSWLQGSRIE